MENPSIFEQISRRTDGNVYIGVVGPVRTGKSTYIKRFMEQLVLPNIENIYERERAKDELPQSGSGKSIMTSEPKFIPEDAVEISPDGKTRIAIRLIDSVGYMVPGAIGAEEDGKLRMVTTPWFDHEITLPEAAELGTKKVMEDHSSIGIVMTTDGSITDLNREDYLDAEKRSIEDMQATGKPFVVLVNSTDPEGSEAQSICRELEQNYGVRCMAVNALTMTVTEITDVLTGLMYEFPVTELRFFLPGWVAALEPDHPMKTAVYDGLLQCAGSISKLREAEPAMSRLQQLEQVQGESIRSVDMGTGVVSCDLRFPDELFYQILSEKSGFEVKDDGDLLELLTRMASIRRDYERISPALEQVRSTGYGIVMPTSEEMHLEVPQIIRKNGNYAVRLKASAPSIHMMRADIETELSPMVGDEKQSETMASYLLGEYEGNTERLWESNIFGKSLYDLVSEGLNTKLLKMPEDARMKLKDTLTRMINENSGGLICIIL